MHTKINYSQMNTGRYYSVLVHEIVRCVGLSRGLIGENNEYRN